jgi:PKD repeat protein
MRRMIRVVSTLAVASSGLLATPASTADAVIATTSGAITQIAPPPSALGGSLNSTTTIWGWNEQQDVTLASNVRVDVNAPGTYDSVGSVVNVTVPAGTVVNSHYFVADHTGPTVLTGTVTFPTDIVGIILVGGRADQTDVLGSTGTTYPGAVSSRGLELAPTEDAVILPNLRTLTIRAHAGTGIDHVRVLTRANNPPVASAGGPYTGVEGSPVALTGAASDPDGTSVSVAWTFAVTAAPGTVCAPTATTTLNPTITCDDDALVTATLVATDPSSISTVSTAQISVVNAAPTMAAIALPTTPVALNATVGVNGSFADAGTHDTHTVDVQWGDTTSSSATVNETDGSGTFTASHVYALPGVYGVTVTTTDDDNGIASESGFVVVDGPPTADAAGPYMGTEGTPTGLVGTATDPENDPMTTDWSFVPVASDAGTTCTYSATTTLAPDVTCNDDAVVSGTLTVDDGINPPVASSTTVTITNTAPVLGTATATAAPIATGTPISIAVPFTDAATNDTHTAIVEWGDTTSSTATVEELAGTGSATATHSYPQPGIYVIAVTVEDDNGAAASTSVEILVNAPPEADAGGPYVGLEGSSMHLAGMASDDNGDALSTTWTFSWTGDPGTACSAVGADTLTPTLVCNDDATVSATLTVDDGVNAPVVSNATITVGNAVPVVGAAVPSAAMVPTDSVVSVSVSFTDAGTNDAHTAIVDWGDATTSGGSVTETSGSGTVASTHLYAAPGTYTIAVTVIDDNGFSATSATSVHVNASPSIDAGGAYSGTEGSVVNLAATAADADADPLSTTWAITWWAPAIGTGCSIAGETTLTPSVTCDDDATVTAALTVSDGVNAAVTETAQIIVANDAPSITAMTAPAGTLPRDLPVVVGADFTDAGAHDTHTATIDWGDGNTESAPVAQGAGSGIVSASHTFAASGTFTITIGVTDDDGATDTATTSVVINGSPTVGAGGPYVGAEGTGASLHATVDDPEDDTLSVQWTSSVVSADVGTTCTLVGGTTLDPEVDCDDDAVLDVTVVIDDSVNAPVSDTTTLTFDNVAPVVTSVTATPSIAAEGSTVSVTAEFADDGTHDTHTALVDWGDGSFTTAAVSETTGTGVATSSHSYLTAGSFQVTVTVTDDDEAQGSHSTDVHVDGAPVVAIGGPYTGVEGAAVTLAATVDDADTPSPTISWTRTIVSADLGTNCVLTGSGTATPTLTCDDDADVDVTLTVDDGINPPIIQSTTVTIGNVNPAVATPTAGPNPVATGGTVSLTASFTDVGVNDTHAATINWGNGVTTGTVAESPGSGLVSGARIYATPGTYTVTVTVSDKDGGATSASTTVVVDAPPTASIGGPYSGTEGTPIAINASANDPDGGLLGRTWSLSFVTDPGATCALTGTSSLDPTLTCNDDAAATVTLTVDDGINPAVTASTIVSVGNVAPAIGSLQVPSSPVAVNTTFSVQGAFTDVGSNDAHTATIDWGDATSSGATVTETSGTGVVTASHAYVAAGSYTVSLTVVDDDTGATTFTATTTVSVYVPTARGFAHGAGLLSSPSGAYTPSNSGDPNVTGYAQFEFHGKTHSNGSVTGNIEFTFKAGNLKFKAVGSPTLNVVGNTATLTMAGSQNHSAGYTATIWVIDGGRTNHDRIRIRIEHTSTGVVLYDNQYASAPGAAPTQAPSTGSIIVREQTDE